MSGYEDFGQGSRWEPDEKGYRVVTHTEQKQKPREVVVMPKQLTVSNRLTAVLLILFVLAAAALAYQASNRMFLEKLNRNHNAELTLVCEIIHERGLSDPSGICRGRP